MGFRNLAEAFAWIESFTNLERSPSLFSSRTYQLDRMRMMAAACGNPQSAYRTVHLAGTKGKGSTAVLLAESLGRSGLRTGLYTSPHVDSYRERIQVLSGREHSAPPATGRLLLEQAGRLRGLIENLPEQTRTRHGPPNTFELLTLLAFCTFRASACDIAVVETGIGGRLDATNIVLPELAVITPIELEHTQVLGDTLQDVAREKAGIFKAGVPVISALQSPEVEAVLRAAAGERGCPITFAPEALERVRVQCSLEGTWVDLRLNDGEERQLRLALLGAHQGENAALAFLALRALKVAPGAIEAGFGAAVLPARMELLQRSPPVVLDGAHTPLSVARLLESFQSFFGDKGVLLFAAAAGKRIEAMASILAPAFRRIVITAPGSFRESRPKEVHRVFADLNPAAELIPDPAAALERAVEQCGAELPLLVTGSFYLAGEVRRAWRQRKTWAGRQAPQGG